MDEIPTERRLYALMEEIERAKYKGNDVGGLDSWTEYAVEDPIRKKHGLDQLHYGQDSDEAHASAEVRKGKILTRWVIVGPWREVDSYGEETKNE